MQPLIATAYFVTLRTVPCTSLELSLRCLPKAHKHNTNHSFSALQPAIKTITTNKQQFNKINTEMADDQQKSNTKSLSTLMKPSTQVFVYQAQTQQESVLHELEQAKIYTVHAMTKTETIISAPLQLQSPSRPVHSHTNTNEAQAKPCEERR